MSEKRNLVCPLCQSTEFKKEEGKINSRWGVTAHKVTLMVCENCRFTMILSRGRTIFDFD